MNLRLHRRVAAVVLSVVLTTAPSVAFAATRDADTPRDVRERIVRIIKKVRQALLPTANDGDGVTPPRPTGNG